MAGSLSLHAACAVVFVAGGALAPSVTPGTRAPIKVTLVHYTAPEAGLEQSASTLLQSDLSDSSDVSHASIASPEEARPDFEPEVVVELAAAPSEPLPTHESAPAASVEAAKVMVERIGGPVPCVIGFEGPLLAALTSYRAEIEARSIAAARDAGEGADAVDSDEREQRERMVTPAPLPPAAPPSATPHRPIVPVATGATIQHNPKPDYPRQARQRGWAGTVVLRVAVREDGSVASVSVLESSGRSLLDRAAISAVREWTFTPATRHGRAVEGMIDVPVVFRLED